MMLFDPLTLMSFGAKLLGRKWLVVGVLLAVAAAGLSVAGYAAARYSAGKRDGVAQDRARSDAVILKMLSEAQAKLVEAQQREDAKEEVWRARLKEAQREAELNRQLNAQRLAAERATAGQLRDQLAAYAAGGAENGADSIAACRDRAATLGVVLGEALRAHAECSGAAEGLAGDVRELLGSWPVDAP